jgi:hypothetical protein
MKIKKPVNITFNSKILQGQYISGNKTHDFFFFFFFVLLLISAYN